MQKAPILKGSGLKPLEETQSSEEVHVFGKNLEERVVTHEEDEKPAPVPFATSQSESSHSENDIESIKKRKFDAITGEEDEETVFQGDFKLFLWDKGSSNWIEKGRGQLKLNDSTEDQTSKSRLIMRISGTLRIILNVSIRQSAFKIIASSKTNIRFTDSLSVWAVSGSNVQHLKDLIEERLVNSEDASVDESVKKPKSDTVASSEAHEDEDPKESTSLEVTKEEKEIPNSEHAETEEETHENTESSEDSNEDNDSDGDEAPEKNETADENKNESQEDTSKPTEPEIDSSKQTESKDETAKQVESKEEKTAQVETQSITSGDNGNGEG